ncbi:hypothetical protein QBC38DRAFT_127369 [Podospora fimiseda]|uniref:Uncharacterized protein n=1 Tax=Podospora fimiseda TaxID=252190 RepID=A0AAN7BST1_9PEZI|nr:hypothetical protein QBC38DRAFT_127369 [Podospora fimiseda]
MDILFSPYGVGAIPKPIMDEIEHKAEDLLRSSSFQQMLELEHKYKMERLQGAQLNAPESPSLPKPDGSHSFQQHQYAGSLAQQQKSLMLKAARGNASPPPLSITIPQPEKGDDIEALTPTNSESFHKQVKFLAPEDSNDQEEDAMSEQSSICQSPSWENYGQRKKDKKLEAERRKKEKIQAEKEAKAAKKRSSSRLSKLQPSTPIPGHGSRVTPAFAHPERSMSDPSLMTPHPTHHQGEFEKDTSEVLNTSNPRLPLRRHMSEGPMAPSQPHTSNTCPPSASRTPMLRHMSPSRHSRSSGGNILQISSSNRSQESLPISSGPDTSRREGYVRCQRAQSTEQALAGLADEELLENYNSRAAEPAPPRNVWPVRRSSLNQDARLAAMKLVVRRSPSTTTAKETKVVTQDDYFAFSAHPYSSYDADTPAPIKVGNLPRPSQKTHTPQEIPFERPATSQSSSAGSITSTQSKKTRSLKEAAKAVLSISNGSKSPGAVSLPPYYALRARMQSRPSVYTESKSSAQESYSSQPVTSRDIASHIAVPDIDKAGESLNQTGSQASEASSSSSACEDGSSLPSPTTTPDTSRPQSVKDLPFTETDLVKITPATGDLQDDQRTLRESLDSSNSTTPRLEETRDRTSENHGSTTALSIDVDCDAQSFTTSVSNLDDANNDTVAPLHPKKSEPRVTSKPSQDVGNAVQNDLIISIPPRSKRRTQIVSSPVQLSPLAPEDTINQEKSPGPEKANRKQKRQSRLQDPDESTSSASSTVVSSRSRSPTSGTRSLSAEYQIPSNPYLEDFPELASDSHLHYQSEPSKTFAASSSVSLPASRSHSVSSQPFAPPRTNSAPILSSAAKTTTTQPAKLAPVSILKQPKNLTDGPSPPLSPGQPSPVLSALPKHMQQFSARQPSFSAVPTAAAPIAKMFVECCSCKFYHDMPSKIYECMTKPDAVVEDRTLGISGAITTMVKCPWCNHNMSMSCCAGYAAVVYLKEKLH